MDKQIRLAIAGIGNCASSLVQGLDYYTWDEDEVGLITPVMGGYKPSDVAVVAAFDVLETKVGLDLNYAIEAYPNNARQFSMPHGDSGVVVQRAPTFDGLGQYYYENTDESKADAVDVVSVLRETQADVLVCYLPVGSQEAMEFYANCALEAKVALVNAIPVFIASDPYWSQRFHEANVPIIGDDIKSQLGATILHRTLVDLFEDRGVVIDNMYQLNFGGNMDFMNMLERTRLKSKKISKTQAVTSRLQHPMERDDVHIGPSDHVPWLNDRKWAYVRIEGRAFGSMPINVEVKLEVEDSPNSAGVIMDAIRCAKLAKDAGYGGPLIVPSSAYMKSPPEQGRDSDINVDFWAVQMEVQAHGKV